MSIIKEFKEFIVRGNVFDMAVGVVIGGAFGKIVSSMVNDIIMPPLGLILGDSNFKDLKLVLKKPIIDDAGKVTQEAVSVNYGAFMQTTLDFLIIAAVIFMVLKTINNLKRKFEKEQVEAPAEEKPAEPTKEEILLTEIRDLLKQRNS